MGSSAPWRPRCFGRVPSRGVLFERQRVASGERSVWLERDGVSSCAVVRLSVQTVRPNWRNGFASPKGNFIARLQPSMETCEDCGPLAETELVASCKRAVGRPLPSYWPAPTVPRAHAQLLATAASLSMFKETVAAEQAGWLSLIKPATASTPPRKKAKAVHRPKVDRDAANQAGTLCKCGKEDTDKFMLQCDGCDVWFHGDCVGVDQAHGMKLKSWRCKPCARRHESVQSRCQLYCFCRGPWDGRSFMIACDGA